MNRDKCNFSTKHCLFGVFVIDKAPSQVLAVFATLAPYYSCLFALNASECDVQVQRCNECIFIQTFSMDSHVTSSIPSSQISANQNSTGHNIGTARSQPEVQKTFQASYQVLPEQISDKFGPFHIIWSHWKPSCTIRAGDSLSPSYFIMHWRHRTCIYKFTE